HCRTCTLSQLGYHLRRDGMSERNEAYHKGRSSRKKLRSPPMSLLNHFGRQEQCSDRTRQLLANRFRSTNTERVDACQVLAPRESNPQLSGCLKVFLQEMTQ